jgi:hypothetical protein
MFIKAGRNLGLALFPKSASSSISNALPHSIVDAETFAKLPMRLAFLREPHERIASAYRMLSWVNPGFFRHDLSSFDNFILRICQGECWDDPHVTPQAWLATHNGKFLPNFVVRWDFDKLEEIIGVPVPHDNAGEQLPVEWSEKSRAMFDEVFEEDLKLWGENGKGTRQPDD